MLRLHLNNLRNERVAGSNPVIGPRFIKASRVLAHGDFLQCLRIVPYWLNNFEGYRLADTPFDFFSGRKYFIRGEYRPTILFAIGGGNV